LKDYRNYDGTIDENKLHMIVTMALNNMDTTFDSSSKRIIIVNISKLSICTVTTKEKSIILSYSEFEFYFFIVNIILSIKITVFSTEYTKYINYYTQLYIDIRYSGKYLEYLTTNI